MKNFTHLATLVFNQPQLCTPEYAETVLAILSDKLNLEQGAFEVQNEAKDPRESGITESGTFVLPIVGSMVHRGSNLDALSGINSYQKIKSDISFALENPKVKNIMLDVDSPGGSVAGAFDLADFIKESAEVKPIYALARDSMCSAGYLISSGATKVYSTQTGSVGSIGVVAMHIDQSKANEQKGVKPTFVFAGDYKVAGNPHEPLEGDKLNYLQESVNTSYEMFVNTVSKNRGLSTKDIRDTEARVYRGQQAYDIGLTDGVRTYEAVLEELSQLSHRESNKPMSRGLRMDNENLNLEADLTKVSGELQDLKAAILAEGYKITADGLVKDKIEEAAVEEMMEIAGVMTPKSSLPAHVVSALEANAAEKADAELTARATAALPSFALEDAKALIKVVDGLDSEASETAMAALVKADKALSNLMEEKGESVDEGLLSAKDQFESLVSAKVAKGMTKEDARAEVTESAEGRALLKQALIEGK